ncbi:MAG: hypothetical protein KI793_26340 [Rivularia sp. (in: Bacteria)]|nr:hypothetical protein [Rivularia sp. MS3]
MTQDFWRGHRNYEPTTHYPIPKFKVRLFYHNSSINSIIKDCPLPPFPES